MFKRLLLLATMVSLTACTSKSAMPENMVTVPAGTFMGCDTSMCRGLVEQSAVDGFQIDRNEVTIAAVKRCIESGKCTAVTSHGEQVETKSAWVTWQEADALCSSRGARLPTAAEWEKAARGPLLLRGTLSSWIAGGKSLLLASPDHAKPHGGVHLDAGLTAQPFRCARSVPSSGSAR